MGKNTKVVKTNKPSKNEYKRDKKVIFKEKHKEPKENFKINWMYVLIGLVVIVILIEAGMIISKKIKTKRAQEYGKEVNEATTDFIVRKFGNGQATLPSGWAYETRKENEYKVLDIYPNEDDLISISSTQYNLESLEMTKEEIYQTMYDKAAENVEATEKHPLVDKKMGNYTYKTPETQIRYKEMYIRPFYYMSMKDGYVYIITITSLNELTDESLSRFQGFFDSIKL